MPVALIYPNQLPQLNSIDQLSQLGFVFPPGPVNPIINTTTPLLSELPPINS